MSYVRWERDGRVMSTVDHRCLTCNVKFGHADWCEVGQAKAMVYGRYTPPPPPKKKGCGKSALVMTLLVMMVVVLTALAF
jgi:hypothetical protein